MDLRILVIGILTFSTAYTSLFTFLLAYSLFRDFLYGFTLYCILGCFTTIYLSESTVRSRLISLYGSKVLRLLGWNNLVVLSARSSRKLAISTGVLIGGGAVACYLHEGPPLVFLSQLTNAQIEQHKHDLQDGQLGPNWVTIQNLRDPM